MRNLLLSAFAIATTMFVNVAQAQTIIETWESVKAPALPEFKSVTVDPSKTALMIMDFNARTCNAQQRPHCLTATNRVKTLLAAARAKNMLIIYTYGPNMMKTDFVSDIAPLPEDIAIQAPGNKFYGTDLEATLKSKGITSLIMTGTASVGAVIGTAIGATERGFNAIIPADTMAADNPYEEQFAVWYAAGGNIFRGRAILTASDKIAF